MSATMNAMVEAAMDAHDPIDPAYRMSRSEALSVVTAVLEAMKAGGEVAVDALLAGSVRAALDVRPVAQGRGFEYLRDGAVVGTLRECMGEAAWSVSVPGKRWKLPEDAPANLIHRRGLMDVTYRPTREAAESLMLSALDERRKILPWPLAA